jgi:hypothetical protein
MDFIAQPWLPSSLDSPMAVDENKEPSPCDQGFYLHQPDSQPPSPIEDDSLFGFLAFSPIERDPFVVAAENKLEEANANLKAYQEKVDERRCHKSKKFQADKLKQLTEEVNAAKGQLMMAHSFSTY